MRVALRLKDEFRRRKDPFLPRSAARGASEGVRRDLRAHYPCQQCNNRLFANTKLTRAHSVKTWLAFLLNPLYLTLR